MGIRVGTRLRCDKCGSEAIITGNGEAELGCCGQPLTVTFEPAPSAAAGGNEG